MKTEAERLDVMDKAAGILAELLYTDQLLTQIKEYRTIMLPVSEVYNCNYRSCVPVCGILCYVIVINIREKRGWGCRELWGWPYND